MYDDWMENVPIFGKIKDTYVKPEEEYQRKYQANWIVFQNDYFTITKENLATRKTPIYHIFNNKNNIEIATIKWYGAWRKYCLFSYEGTIWDNKCLTSIIDFLNEINKKVEN